jgi:hypothetical protein
MIKKNGVFSSINPDQMDFRNIERPVEGCTPKNMQGGGHFAWERG